MSSSSNEVNPEDFQAMQQRLLALESLITQSTNTMPAAEYMDDAEEQGVATALHHYIYDLLILEDQKGRIIEQYPNLDNVQYQPPAAVPAANRMMAPHQSKLDKSLKHLQYLLSGVVRPIDVLGLEISHDDNTTNIQRYLHVLADCHTLLLNISSEINALRNDIAFKAINPSYSANKSSSQNYTMSPTDFQASLTQQTTTNQTLRHARPKKRSNHSNSHPQQSKSNFQPQQFFSISPNSPLSVRTIQRWLKRPILISTQESRATLRSIVSSLALQSGIPKDDIVNLGNWDSSTTFENHYR
ncbi:hypothetical protein K501DRAFT_280672 [Backusella circina FSU 941]|nr:hypothetical protein K501DRAFT_280672 [Backusella circina FSU 941]